MISDLQDSYEKIEEKGGTIPEHKNTNNLPPAIESISGGGEDYDPTDPAQVYEHTRPSNWLKMPDDANVANNEFYLLLDVANARTDNFNTRFSLSATARYDIEFGTVVDGAFVADPTYALLDCPAGAYSFTTLSIPMSIFHSIGNTKQVIMRIKTLGNIQSLTLSDFGKQALNKQAVEMKGKATEMTYFSIGTNTAGSSAYSLKYFSLLGSNQITNFSSFFSNCYSLLAVLALDTHLCTNASGMFLACRSLIATPPLTVTSCTNFSAMFRGCTSLHTAPQLNTAAGTDFHNMFEECVSLAALPKLTTSAGTNLAQMFWKCYSFTSIDLSDYNFSSATSMGMFLDSSDLDGGGKIYLPNRNKFPSGGILESNTFKLVENNSNPIDFIITDDSEMIPIANNATSVFGSSSYVLVFVPDSLYDTYQADSKWATLGTRLKKLSELPA